jgi:Zn-dependent M32 family carboxypeptidase
MTIDISFLDIVKIVAMLIGAAWLLLEINARQFSKRIDEKFAEVEKARTEAGAHWDTRYGKTEKAVAELAQRVVRMETEIKHVPTQAAFNNLTEAVTQVRGQNETQTQLLERMERQMNLMNEWMMENK